MPFCPKCEMYTAVAHPCVPRWEVLHEWYGYDRDAMGVFARTAKEAAEKWAEEVDSDNEYGIVAGCPETVGLLRQGEDVSHIVWIEVYGESVPRYHASSVGQIEQERLQAILKMVVASNA